MSLSLNEIAAIQAVEEKGVDNLPSVRMKKRFGKNKQKKAKK